MKILKYLLFIYLFLIITENEVRADIFSNDPSCLKPYKPLFTDDKNHNDFLFNMYKLDVERYKSCIETFIEDEENQIKNHREAQEKAIDAWNHFIKFEN